MPSASSYTNKVRFAASVKNTKAQLQKGVGNLTQGSIAGCGLGIQYTPINYVELCGCRPHPPPLPPVIINTFLLLSNFGIENARPHGIVKDFSGNYYICDTEGAIVYKYFPSTNIISQFITNIENLRSPRIDLNGNIFIIGIQSSKSKIIQIDINSNITTFYEYDSVIPISEIAVSNNAIYVVESLNNVISSIDFDGNRTELVSVNTPYGIVIDNTSNYLFISANNSIYRYNLLTNELYQMPPIIGLTSASGMDIDSNNNIYITDPENYVVWQLTPSGSYSVIAGSFVGGYSGDGRSPTYAKLSASYGVYINNEEHSLYISDYFNGAIRKVSNIF